MILAYHSNLTETVLKIGFIKWSCHDFILKVKNFASLWHFRTRGDFFLSTAKADTHARVLQHEIRSSKDLGQLIFYTLTWQNSLKPRAIGCSFQPGPRMGRLKHPPAVRWHRRPLKGSKPRESAQTTLFTFLRDCWSDGILGGLRSPNYMTPARSRRDEHELMLNDLHYIVRNCQNVRVQWSRTYPRM